MATETFSQDLIEAIDRALKQRRDLFLIAGAGVALSVFLAWYFGAIRNTKGDDGVLVILPGIAAAIYAATQFRKAITREVMPILCREMFGWHFREKAHNRDIAPLQAIGLLPINGYPETLSDTVGRTHGRFIETWGVRFVRGAGKGRRIYPAYVCELPAKPEWSGLCIVPTSFGYPFRQAKIASSLQPVMDRGFLRIGLNLNRRGGYDGHIDRLTNLVQETDELFHDGARLVGIYFDDMATRVVIRDKTHPLSLGGLFLTHRQIIARLIDRIGELSIPLRICEIWELPRGDVSLSAAAPAPPATSDEVRSAG